MNNRDKAHFITSVLCTLREGDERFDEPPMENARLSQVATAMLDQFFGKATLENEIRQRAAFVAGAVIWKGQGAFEALGNFGLVRCPNCGSRSLHTTRGE